MRTLWTLTLLLAATSAALLSERIWAPPKAEAMQSLELTANETDGRVRVNWDPRSPLVREADSATLEVNDGGDKARYPVQAGVLNSGRFVYMRRSSDVLLVLTLLQDGHPAGQGILRTIGSVAAPAAPKIESTRSRTEPTRAKTRRKRGRR